MQGITKLWPVKYNQIMNSLRNTACKLQTDNHGQSWTSRDKKSPHIFMLTFWNDHWSTKWHVLTLSLMAVLNYPYKYSTKPDVLQSLIILACTSAPALFFNVNTTHIFVIYILSLFWHAQLCFYKPRYTCVHAYVHNSSALAYSSLLSLITLTCI